MNNQVRIGFNIHPRWLSGTTAEDFFAPLMAAGLQSVEIDLDDQQPAWAEYPALMESCHLLGLEICFHAPYRLYHSISGFSGEAMPSIETRLETPLRFADAWAERNQRLAAVVVHPAKSRTRSREDLYRDTCDFLSWILARYQNLRIAVENMGPPQPGETKIGANRAEILQIVNDIAHPRLGICWDFGHDVLAGKTSDPDPAWLGKVIHVHAHDIDQQGVDHYPLIFDTVPAEHWLHLLSEAGMTGIATLEIKGGQLSGWTPDEINRMLQTSIQKMKRCL